MIPKIAIAISLLSMGIGVSYWEAIGTSLNLRGVDVATRDDETNVLDGTTDEFDDRDIGAIKDDELRSYNLSPYDKHWPGYQLDPWMRKQVDDIPSKQNEVCLVHVGKVSLLLIICSLLLHVSKP